jgi:NAD(P)-dependent dehydrogenase (short-subunit alcohol dehydrogenase family)
VHRIESTAMQFALAVRMFTQVLKQTLTACLGTETAMVEPILSREGVREKIEALHPFRGLGRPEDIAKAAVFLASDESSWMTGVLMPVDGGYTAK